MKRIIETNVPLTANGVSSMSLKCALKCIDLLDELMRNGKIVIDNGYRIIKEYQRKLPTGGDDKIGDVFLEWVLTYQRNSKKVETVEIKESSHKETWFEEIPVNIGLEDFDPSDLKFIAVAFRHTEKPSIVNAADTDWLSIKDILPVYGITVDNICEKELEELQRNKSLKKSMRKRC